MSPAKRSGNRLGSGALPLVDDVHSAISRDEWTNWQGRRFGRITERTGGEMPAADYETWAQRGAATD